MGTRLPPTLRPHGFQLRAEGTSQVSPGAGDTRGREVKSWLRQELLPGQELGPLAPRSPDTAKTKAHQGRGELGPASARTGASGRTLSLAAGGTRGRRNPADRELTPRISSQLFSKTRVKSNSEMIFEDSPSPPPARTWESRVSGASPNQEVFPFQGGPSEEEGLLKS